ncbi:MAG: FixH family protein [Ignavibacteriae bacterium]|nr:FixH family protein [Ignavibacteriota bacterium]
MNWGIKILIFYLGFVVMVLASVFFAMTQRVELVSDNYYEKELKYQEQIDKSQRTKSLKEKTEIQLIDRQIKIKFPNLPDKNYTKYSILLYRPSDPSKDLKISVLTDSLGIQIIPIEKLAKGFWKIKINWASNEAEYYDESILNIP